MIYSSFEMIAWIIRARVTPIILLLFFFISPLSTPDIISANSYGTTTIYEPKHLHLTDTLLDQLTPQDVLLETLSILENRTQGTAWDLPSHTDDPISYTGLAGGMAGIGMKFLEATSANSLLDVSTKTRLLQNAKAVADTLLLQTVENNDSHVLWNVTSESGYIDLGWDFGLAGIASFFTELYNQTGIQSYADISKKTLQSIYDLANHTNGLSWNVNITKFISAFAWYPVGDLFLIPSLEATFSGLAFGTTGMSRAALHYIRDTNDGSNVVALDIINESLEWMDSQSQYNASEISFNMTSEFFGVKSNSISTGAAGIGKLYLDLASHFDNQTYSDIALGIMHWLNGTDTNISRWDGTWEVNGTLEGDFEIGLSHGLAGVLSFITDIYEANPTLGLGLLVESALNLIGKGIEDGNGLKFPERENGGVRVDDGSSSFAHGAAGIYAVLLDTYTIMNASELQQTANRIRQYLLSQLKTENQYSSIKDIRSNNLENNPSRGLPGFVLMLALPTQGSLQVETTELDFSQVTIGSSQTLNVSIVNIGDFPISFTQVFVPATVFSVHNDEIDEILGRSSINLIIVFEPQVEQRYSSVLSIISENNNKFDITVEGIGFDNPVIEILEAKENNSLITTSNDLTFRLNVNDSSSIKQVSLGIGSSSTNLVNTPGSSEYSIDWRVQDLENGTYALTFTAVDVAEHSTTLILVYTIGFYTSDIAEQVFSDRNLMILIIIVGVLIIAAVVLTRKYLS
ncbi:MAG: lanthionine synthetase LanC family protein [Candidatus Kariarchaeaceae archaeon]|jgi:hypothetical protein